MKTIQQYVCGFLFSEDRTRVLLIRKNRPAWQAGKLNGVGGKIGADETPAQAMCREFREEASRDFPESAWQHIVTLSGDDDAGAGRRWAGHFFRAFGEIESAKAMTDEVLEIHPTAALPADVIPNLKWMIPLLLDDEVARQDYAVSVCTGAAASRLAP